MGSGADKYHETLEEEARQETKKINRLLLKQLMNEINAKIEIEPNDSTTTKKLKSYIWYIRNSENIVQSWEMIEKLLKQKNFYDININYNE